jgi:hypothetical protein
MLLRACSTRRLLLPTMTTDLGEVPTVAHVTPPATMIFAMVKKKPPAIATAALVQMREVLT